MSFMIVGILAALFSIVVTVLTFVFIVPEKKRAKLNGFWKFIHDTVNFKYLIVEKILQALYIFATAFVILGGFFMLFCFQSGYESYYYRVPATWYGGYGILLMILGPIAVRLVYEFLMMAILLIKNVIQINNKLKSEGNDSNTDIFTTPTIETAQAMYGNENQYTHENAQPPVNTYTNAGVYNKEVMYNSQNTYSAFCPTCGSKIENSNVCHNCGTVIK